MAAPTTSVSLGKNLLDRVREEAEATGLKMSTIVQQALAARYAAQDAKAAQ